MEIQRCFENLEVSQDASIEDVRQAYKDLINIWHPDRVPDNPRLKKKAEEKLKNINLAYAELTSFLSSQQKSHANVQRKPPEQPITKTPPPASRAQTQTKTYEPDVDAKPKTNFFSTLWTYLSKALDTLSEIQGSSNEAKGTRSARFEPTRGQGQNRGRGMGRGKGMGGGRRGKGRRH